MYAIYSWRVMLCGEFPTIKGRNSSTAVDNSINYPL